MSEEATPIVDDSGLFTEQWRDTLPEEHRSGEFLEGITSPTDLVTRLAEAQGPRPFTMEDYRNMLPEDLRESEDLSKFKDPAEIYKSFREVQKIASRRGDLPTSESTPEEIAAFWQKAGTPEGPDGYELAGPEGLEIPENFSKTVTELAHKHNMPKEMLEGFVSDYLAFETQLAEGEAAEAAEKEEAAVQMLKTEWGENADEMIVGVRQTASMFGATADDMTKIENDPGLALLFGRIYGQLDERGMAGQVYAGTMAGIDTQVAEIDQQILQLFNENPNDPRIKDLQAKKASLNQRRGRYDNPEA